MRTASQNRAAGRQVTAAHNKTLPAGAGSPVSGNLIMRIMRILRIGSLGAWLFACALLSIGFYSPLATAQGKTLRQAFEAINKAVVVVRTESSAPAPKGGWTSADGLGSGVLVSRDGLVMTASHVVQTADRIEVLFSDGQTSPARVVSSLTRADVALLQLENPPKGIEPARLGNSSLAHVGDPVFVVGAPYALYHSLTSGHLSARRKFTNAFTGGVQIEFLQTDAAINSGNSGGPLFDMDGRVIGIVSHIHSRSGGFEGLGFAVASNVARRALLEQRALWTGVEGTLLSGQLAALLNVPQREGLLVQRVARDSPADRMGVRPGRIPAKLGDEEMLLGGDIVLFVGDLQVTGEEAQIERIDDYLSNLRAGQSVSVRVLREGQVIDLLLR